MQYAKPLAQSGGKHLLTSQFAISQSGVQVFKDGMHKGGLTMSTMRKLRSLLIPMMRMPWKNSLLLPILPYSCSLDANVSANGSRIVRQLCPPVPPAVTLLGPNPFSSMLDGIHNTTMVCVIRMMVQKRNKKRGY